eukprot:scaffold274075_cov19-Tisochrysis_lutea.AAC.1
MGLQRQCCTLAWSPFAAPAFFGVCTGLKYEDEILEDLKKRTAPNSGQDAKPEKPLRKVCWANWSRLQGGLAAVMLAGQI